MHPPRVRDAGVHTQRLGVRLDIAARDRLLRTFKHRPIAGGGCEVLNADGSRVLAGQVRGDWHVVLYPSSLLVAEGHPSGAVTALAGAGRVQAAAKEVLSALEEHVVEASVGQAECRRVDTAVTLEFPSSKGGVELLNALAHIRLPRTKPAVIGGASIESVSGLGFRSSKPLWRGYDCGTFYSDAVRGRLIRLEDVWRPRGRLALESFSARFLRDRFWKRFELLSSVTSIRQIRVESLLEELVVRHEAGAMTSQEAERMNTFLMAQAAGLEKRLYSAETLKNRRREARSHGLVVSAAAEREAVNVAAVLASAKDLGVWA